MDATKTGRFGLGFNSVYNVTDWPFLLTIDRLGVFDPHADRVPNATRTSPGKAWPLRRIWKDWPDLLQSFLDFDEGFAHEASTIAGTVFRLPLRTEIDAESSEIKNEAFTSRDFDDIVAEIKLSPCKYILFLKNVQQFRIGRFSCDGKYSELLSVKTQNTDEISAFQCQLRQSLAGEIQDVLTRLSFQPADVVLQTQQDIVVNDGATERTETWLRVQGLYVDSELLNCARSMVEIPREKAIPLAGAAGCLTHQCEDYSLYCTLPLPVASEVNCHVDGFFDLEDSRQNYFNDSTASGGDKIRFQWNQELLKRACASAVAKLYCEMAKRNHKHYASWPTCSESDHFAKHVYQHMCKQECISVGWDQRWVSPVEVKMPPNGFKIEEPLLELEVAIPQPSLPAHVIDGFKQSGNALSTITPQFVRDKLRDQEFESCPLDEAPEHLASKEWLVELLGCCLSDGKSEDFAHVPLALDATGLLNLFSSDNRFFIGDKRDRNLFGRRPEVFLDEQCDATIAESEVLPIGVRRMTLGDAICLIPSIYSELDESGFSSTEDEDRPSHEWLVAFYEYVVARTQKGDPLPDKELLKKVPLVPDQDGRIWGLGVSATPFLAAGNKERKDLEVMLKKFGIPFIAAKLDLEAAITAYVGHVENPGIRKLSAVNLIQTLSATSTAWLPKILNAKSKDVRPIFDFLSKGPCVNGLKNAGPASTKTLRLLPIFPTTNGDLTAIDLRGKNDIAHLAVDFTPPKTAKNISLLDTGKGGKWRALFELIGAKKLTRARLVVDKILPTYESMTRVDKEASLKWIRKEYQTILDELRSNTAQFTANVKSAKLIPCDDGINRPITRVYHPDSSDIRDLLPDNEDGIGFPDMEEFFAREPERWIKFLSDLGMEATPRANDILDAIDLYVSTSKDDTPRVPDSVNKIERLVRFLNTNWSSLRDSKVTCEKEQLTLLDALQRREWLPALEEPSKNFPAKLFKKSEKTWHFPKEVIHFESLDLASTSFPVCRFNNIKTIGSDLGIKSPDVSDTLVQLRAFLAIDRSDANDGKVSRRGSQLLQRVYDWLGKLQKAADESEQSRIASECLGFEEIPCLFDDEHCLWPPCHTFETNVSFFLGYRNSIQYEGDANDGARLLGRKKSPSPNDFRKFFHEVARDHEDKPIQGDEIELILQAYATTVEVGLGREFTDTPVLDDLGCLCDSSSVFENDAPWLSDAAKNAGIRFLNSKLGHEVAKLFGVARLSDSFEQRVDSYEPGGNQDFRELCSKLEDNLQSLEFARGIDRLAKSVEIDFSRKPEGLSQIVVRPVVRLTSELYSFDREEILAGSSCDADVLLCDDSHELFVLELDRSILFARLADALGSFFFRGAAAQSIESKLAVILNTAPEYIDETLDQLRVPKLATSSVVSPVNDENSKAINVLDDETQESEGEEDTDEPNSSPTGELFAGDEEPSALAVETPSNIDGNTTQIDSGDVASDNGDSTVRGGSSKRGNSTKGDTSDGEHDQTGPQLDDDTDKGRSTDNANDGSWDDGDEDYDHEADDRDWDDGDRDEDDGEIPAAGDWPSREPGSPRKRRGRPKPRKPSRSKAQKGARKRHSPSPNRRATTYVHTDDEDAIELSEDQKQHRSRVDEVAIRFVSEHESTEGRIPEEITGHNPGYDVESRNATGSLERYIEVKGLSGGWTDFGVKLTPTQIEFARSNSDRFWLYVVEFALGTPKLYTISNPLKYVTDYRFDGGWKAIATTVSEARNQLPKTGLVLQSDDFGQGIIVEVQQRGKLYRLRVDFDDGEKTLTFNPARMQLESP